MKFRDKYGYPVERIKGRHVQNFLRLLIHTNWMVTWRKRNYDDMAAHRARCSDISCCGRSPD